MAKKEVQYEFAGKVVKKVYGSNDFQVYALDVDGNKYPYVKRNVYNNVSISGEMPELTIGAVYNVVATETVSKYGTSYKIAHIGREKPRSACDVKLFLQEVLTEKQADALYNAYPNIIDKIKNDDVDDIDLSKLHGIGEKKFEKIKEKIVANFFLMDLVAEFKGFISLKMMAKIYQKYPSIDTLKEKFSSEPYACLTRISGVGFKKADAIILKLQDSNVIDFGYDIRMSKDRCLACVCYLLEENEKKGNTKASLTEIRRSCLQLVPECADLFTEAIDSSIIYYDKDAMDIALSETYYIERTIATEVFRGLHNNANVWDFDVEKYRDAGEFRLSDEQAAMLEVVCKNTISILNGFAGAGKTSATKALINMLEDNKKTYSLLAPTGKASKVVSEFTGRKASTVSMSIMDTYRGGYSCFDTDIVIVDEFSMCDVHMFERLLRKIDFNKTKLLLIGDSAQLASVGCGNLMHDFIGANMIPTVTLTNVFRYQDGGLMKCATDIRCNRPYLNNSMKNKVTSFGDKKDYVFIDIDSDTIFKYTVALYAKLLKNGSKVKEIQVLTAQNKGSCGSKALNDELQKIANPNYGIGSYMTVWDTTYYVGDVVLQRANFYMEERDESDFLISKHLVVANGEVGKITNIDGAFVNIDFDGVQVRYTRDDMANVSLGYAISIHKSQGSGIDNVIVCNPKSHTFMLNNNMLYVALTRARKKCYHISEIKTINQAIYKKENLQRNTFMKKLLRDMIS